MDGHRKLSFGLATLLGGEVAGQDIVQFLWDQVAGGLGADAMPDKVGAGIFALLAALVWYRTREPSQTRELTLVPAFKAPGSSPDAGARAFDDTITQERES